MRCGNSVAPVALLLFAVPILLGARAIQREVTVRDVVEMRRLAHPGYVAGGSAAGRAASISPDKSRFVAVTRAGDVASNTNVYAIHLWKTEQVMAHATRPKVVLKMSSSSIRDAIDASSIVWSDDSRTITFLGEAPGEHQQVMSLDAESGVLARVVSHPTNIRAFSFNDSRSHLVFTAERAFESLWNDQTRRHGVVVTYQYLPDLIVGREGYHFRGAEDELDVFIHHEGRSRRLPVEREVAPGGVWVSPNGDSVVVPVHFAKQEVPAEWSEYQDPLIRYLLSFDAAGGHGASAVSALTGYEIVSVDSGEGRILLAAPMRTLIAPVWGNDGRTVFLSDTFLPLDTDDRVERDARLRGPATVELELSSGRINRIGGCVRALRWVASARQLICSSGSDADEARVVFEKTRHGWQESRSGMEPRAFEIVLKEDMNTPPKLYLHDVAQGRDILLEELDPAINELRLGKVEEVVWEWRKGREIRGGLYYPPGYDGKRRYPLVIQTHHWRGDRFWIDGPWSTAYAAQPLAARNIMVLQLDEAPMPLHRFDIGALQEVQDAVSIYKSAIAELDRRGLIDPRKVGVIGFSHTCFYVKWALAHEPTLFAAATVAEGEDAGYLQYMTGMNNYVDERTLYGGPPFGEQLDSWQRLAPGFNLHRVRTPLWINSLNARFLLLDWEWFDGLRMLRKPVELLVFHNEQHIVQMPAHRMASLQGNVDWFDFWLNGRERDTPESEQQYRRWRALRALHDSLGPP